MISSTVTVGTTATLLIAATENATRNIILEAVGNSVSLGGSNVTNSTGLTLANGAQIQIVLPPHNSLYGIVPTGTHQVIVLQPSGDF